MIDEAAKLLDKAARAIRAAELLVADGEADFAAGRAYFAMLYVAQALLADRGLRFRKYAGVHAAFGEHLTKTGDIDPKFHRRLLDAFDRRLQADYGLETTVTPEEAHTSIEQARELLDIGRTRLGMSR